MGFSLLDKNNLLICVFNKFNLHVDLNYHRNVHIELPMSFIKNLTNNPNGNALQNWLIGKTVGFKLSAESMKKR